MCCLQIYFSGGDAFGDNVTMADTATDTVDDVVTNDVARDAIASCLHGSIDDSDDDDVDSSYVSDTLIVSQVPDAVFEQQPAQVITGCSVSLSLAPLAQCPLVSTTYFTRWIHFFLSISNLYRVQMSLLHQSARSSIHLLLGLPLLFLPSIIPKTTCFISLSSCILHMWPKKFIFFSIILCMMLMSVPILFIISLFFIFCCHFMFNIFLRHFVS